MRGEHGELIGSKAITLVISVTSLYPLGGGFRLHSLQIRKQVR